MTVIISDLHYLEAKLKRRKWLPQEDKLLIEFADVEPTMLVPMLNGRVTVREIRARQRNLGVRQMTNSLEYHRRKRNASNVDR